MSLEGDKNTYTIKISLIDDYIFKVEKDDKVYCETIEKLNITPNEEFYRKKIKNILCHQKNNYIFLEQKDYFILRYNIDIFNDILEIKMKKSYFLSENEMIKKLIVSRKDQKNISPKNIEQSKNTIVKKSIVLTTQNNVLSKNIEQLENNAKDRININRVFLCVNKGFIVHIRCICLKKKIICYHIDCGPKIYDKFNVKNKNPRLTLCYKKSEQYWDCCPKHKKEKSMKTWENEYGSDKNFVECKHVH